MKNIIRRKGGKKGYVMLKIMKIHKEAAPERITREIWKLWIVFSKVIESWNIFVCWIQIQLYGLRLPRQPKKKEKKKKCGKGIFKSSLKELYSVSQIIQFSCITIRHTIRKFICSSRILLLFHYILVVTEPTFSW